jgi:hypothetical protein
MRDGMMLHILDAGAQGTSFITWELLTLGTTGGR